MNGAQLHLLVNHFPVVLQLVGLPVALYGTVRKEAALQRLGLGLMVLAATFTAVAYLTGDSADEVIKHYPEIVRDSVKNHVLAAQWALRSGIIIGLFSGWLLFRCIRGSMPARGWWIAHTVVALWAMSVVMVTSHWGGTIRHVEIQADHTSP